MFILLAVTSITQGLTRAASQNAAAVNSASRGLETTAETFAVTGPNVLVENILVVMQTPFDLPEISPFLKRASPVVQVMPVSKLSR